jgi:hypothetical protein
VGWALNRFLDLHSPLTLLTALTTPSPDGAKGPVLVLVVKVAASAASPIRTKYSPGGYASNVGGTRPGTKPLALCPFLVSAKSGKLHIDDHLTSVPLVTFRQCPS